ncbi:MAG: hypothetical protein E7269_07930 [Lachnospiraceae bacterium]|nr:hypothetical protein [Lachnospiraceae bacterium]
MEQKINKRNYKFFIVASVVILVAVCIIAVIIILLGKDEEIIYSVEDAKNEIFTEEYFRNVQSVELYCTYLKGDKTLTDTDEIQELVTILSQLTLKNSDKDVREYIGNNGLALYLLDGTEKTITFTSELIGLEVDGKAITFELEEGAFDKIMSLFK